MTLQSIDLDLAARLRADGEFRREWFRAELEYGVPEQFRALREDRRLTQTKLAEKADMKQSAISRFEKSTDANWNFETLLKLAEAMDAQLQIKVIKAEDVMARIEREERAATVHSALAETLKAVAATGEAFERLGANVGTILRHYKMTTDALAERPNLQTELARTFNSTRASALLADRRVSRLEKASQLRAEESKDEESESEGSQDGDRWFQRDSGHRAFQPSPA